MEAIDLKLITFFKKVSLPVARFSLFIIFFWFGLLKVLGLSPASQLVQNLFESTIPIMSFDLFIILFGIFECLIGVLFVVKGVERVAIFLLSIHMVMTLGPLILLTEETWQSFLVPTLEGQYIIKNLVIIASAIGIASHLHPMKSTLDK